MRQSSPEKESSEAVRQLYEIPRGRVQCAAEDRTIYQNRYVFSSRIICGECGSTFRRQKIYIGKPYEKIRWSCHQHIEDISKSADRRLCVGGWNQAGICPAVEPACQ
ncbi:MAG: recombinase zinc beta ribbon domain-containing protein [Enterocloster clostridioformis]